MPPAADPATDSAGAAVAAAPTDAAAHAAPAAEHAATAAVAALTVDTHADHDEDEEHDREVDYDAIPASPLPDDELPDYEALYHAPGSGSTLVGEACINLNGKSIITIVRGTPDIIPAVRQAIVQEWPHGIDSERQPTRTATYGFVLHGNPFGPSGRDAVRSRAMVLAIIQAMGALGWRLRASVGTNRRIDKDTLIFRRLGGPAAHLNHAAPAMFAMSLNRNNTLRLIGDIVRATGIVGVVRHAINSSWRGVSERDYAGAVQFRLSGVPWHPQGKEAVTAAQLLANIVTAIRHAGFRVAACTNMSTLALHFEGEKAKPALDTWFFEADEAPAAPANGSSASVGLFGAAAGSAAADSTGPACIAFAGLDILRIIGGNPATAQALSRVVEESWGLGIKHSGRFHDAVELKLNGTPWKDFGASIYEARILMRNILAEMARRGWSLVASANTATRSTDNPTLFFEPCEPVSEVDILVISLDDLDVLSFFGGSPGDHKVLGEAIQFAIDSVWGRGVRKIEKSFSVGNSAETSSMHLVTWKFEDRLWWPMQTSVQNKANALVSRIVHLMSENGFEVLASILHVNNSNNADTMYFRRVVAV